MSPGVWLGTAAILSVFGPILAGWSGGLSAALCATLPVEIPLVTAAAFLALVTWRSTPPPLPDGVSQFEVGTCELCGVVVILLIGAAALHAVGHWRLPAPYAHVQGLG